MSDLREQVQALREMVARKHSSVAARYAAAPERVSPEFSDGAPEPVNTGFPRRFLEEILNGGEVETGHGRHFETERLYEKHRSHGSADIGALCDLPLDLFETISEGSVPWASPAEWAFLDTETTGLAGGTGAYAFLVGVGRIAPEGFRVRQFFMRDYAEEASLLQALAEHLEPFKVLVTYNGRTFDQPLLETRYRMNRARPPFGRLEHLDLLYGARRLWKLRYDSCRLVDLENQVLGVEREGDVPGSLIPYLYFDYLRTGEAGRLAGVFYHNATDILTLACLAGIVPYAFRGGGDLPLRHGAEMAGIARWLRQAGELEQSRDLFRRAVDAGLKDDLLFRTLWDIAALERKLENGDAALAVWTDLAECRNPYRIKALEELAKHYEHRAKDPVRALELTRAALGHALGHGDGEALRHRESRLTRRAKQLGLLAPG